MTVRCCSSNVGTSEAGSGRSVLAIRANTSALSSARMHQRDPERIDKTCVDQLAEAMLRLLGVRARAAARLAARPIPPTDTW